MHADLRSQAGLLAEASIGTIAIGRRGFLARAVQGGIAVAAAGASFLRILGHRLDAIATAGSLPWTGWTLVGGTL